MLKVKQTLNLLFLFSWSWPQNEPKQSKSSFNQQDLIEQTQGIECRKDSGVVDEIPSAYKDIDEVIANQADLIEVVHTLKQVLCIKG